MLLLQQLSAISKKIISPSLVQPRFPTFPGRGGPHHDEVPSIHQLLFISIFVITLNILQTLLRKHPLKSEEQCNLPKVAMVSGLEPSSSDSKISVTQILGYIKLGKDPFSDSEIIHHGASHVDSDSDPWV